MQKAAGLITTCHTGGASIPGSGAITGDHLLAMQPHVSFHINGGPTAMPDRDFERVIKESDIALQVCTAGNLRTHVIGQRSASLRTAWRLRPLHHRHRYADRLGHHAARHAVHDRALRKPHRHAPGTESFICAATGSNARVLWTRSGLLAAGNAADIVLLDAPDGSALTTALAAIKHGDIAAIGGVISAGVPRFVGRSRNTPPTTSKARVVRSAVMQDFSAAAHGRRGIDMDMGIGMDMDQRVVAKRNVRLAAAAKYLASNSRDGLIAVSNGLNNFLESNAVYVLSGVRPMGESAVVVDRDGRSTLIVTPAWDAQRASSLSWTDHTVATDDLAAELASAVAEYHIAVPRSLSVGLSLLGSGVVARIEAALGVLPQAADELARDLARIRTAEELKAAEHATWIAERGYEHLLERARPGMREYELAAELYVLQQETRRRGLLSADERLAT